MIRIYETKKNVPKMSLCKIYRNMNVCVIYAKYDQLRNQQIKTLCVDLSVHIDLAFTEREISFLRRSPL